jgi:hypothetical protein
MGERLKNDLDEAADREGVSLNSWIVRALTGAVARGSAGAPPAAKFNPHRITGWING